jgi:hypothetical protein
LSLRSDNFDSVGELYTANVLNKLPKSQQFKAKRELQEIWMAETKKDALAAARPPLAAENKCLAQSNKPRTGIPATKKCNRGSKNE